MAFRATLSSGEGLCGIRGGLGAGVENRRRSIRTEPTRQSRKNNAGVIFFFPVRGIFGDFQTLSKAVGAGIIVESQKF